jgi:N-succinyldiaminopimelate aminotransferase
MRSMSEFDDTIARYSRVAVQRGAADLCSGAWPAGTPDFLRRALGMTAGEDAAAYPPLNGIPALRSEIARHYFTPHAPRRVEHDEVTIVPGTTGAMFLAFVAFLEPGDEILIPVPSYGVSIQAAKAAGVGVVRVPAWCSPAGQRGWMLDVGMLRRAINTRTAAVLVCDPDNPTGAILDPDDWIMLKALCHEHDLLLLVDRTYERFPNRKAPVPTAALADRRTLIASSISKSLRAAGLRVGWLITDSSFQERLAEAATLLFGGVTSVTQLACAAALKDMPFGFFDRQADESATLASGLADALAHTGIMTWPVDGGLFLDIPAKSIGARCSEQAWETLLRIGIGGVPSSAFFADPSYSEPFVRLSFARSKTLLATAASYPPAVA